MGWVVAHGPAVVISCRASRQEDEAASRQEDETASRVVVFEPAGE